MRGAATQAMPVCIVEERQQSRCPPAAAPLRAAARRPAGGVARSLHTAPGMLVARALPAGLGASSKMYTLFPDGPLVQIRVHLRFSKQADDDEEVSWDLPCGLSSFTRTPGQRRA